MAERFQVRTFGRGGRRNEGRVVGPKWQFKQYGQCGKYISDLFPHLATCADDIAFLHSMTADSPIHGSAMLQMNTGKILSGSPCLGSWVNYGLGTVNQNLPGFVRHARSDRRADFRGQELDQRLHARLVSGHDLPLQRGADSRSGSPGRHVAGDAAALPGHLERIQRRASGPACRQQQSGGPHRQLRTRLPHAEPCRRGRGPGPGNRSDASASMGWTIRARPISPASASWPAGWSNAASASSRSTPAAPTTTTTGTPTATSWPITIATPAAPTSRSPG